MNIELKVAAMTMVRNDRFLRKWVQYYGRELGEENLYVFFDGEDQEVPDFCAGVNTQVIPKMKGNVVQTDRQRAAFMSEQARKRFAEGYAAVIATDADEFLIVEPYTGLNLRELIGHYPNFPTISGLGVDVLQHLPDEGSVDFSKPFLQQRRRGWLHSRYTKPSVIYRPLRWGGGYHRVKGKNFHIVPSLYLFHFGGVDQEALREISEDSSRRGNGWDRHQLKRLRALKSISGKKTGDWHRLTRLVRRMQTICRPIFALNKPSTYGMKFVAEIPERFRDLV